jgi:plasmid maintenance system antidote protein VapI
MFARRKLFTGINVQIYNFTLIKLEIAMDQEHPQTLPPGYNPNYLLDVMLEKLKLKNDAALSRMLEVAPPVISKIRHRRLPVGASMLIRLHEVSDLSVAELRGLLGDRRQKYRLSAVQGKPKHSAASAK